MTEEDELQEPFQRLARAVPQTAGAGVEECVRAAFRARLNGNSRRWRYVPKAAAASAVVAAGLYLIWTDWRQSRASAGQTAISAPVHQRAGFIALPYAQSEVPLEQPVIVRVQIPVFQLGAIGMPVAPATAEERVSADLLVGQDGIARAVRLVE
jgi:hypothetical protein